MGEEAGCAFGSMPEGEFRPELRKFFIPETGGHANPGIVESDGMAAQEREKTATERSRPVARGFRSGKKGCDSCEMKEEFPELFNGKVMKKKVGKNQIRGWGLTGPFEDFAVDDGGQPVLATQLIEAGIGNRRLPIHKKEAASPSPGGKGQGENAAQEVSIS